MNTIEMHFSVRCAIAALHPEVTVAGALWSFSWASDTGVVFW